MMFCLSQLIGRVWRNFSREVCLRAPGMDRFDSCHQINDLRRFARATLISEYLRQQLSLPSPQLCPASSTDDHLREAGEWTFGRFQVLDPLENLTSRCWHQAHPHPGCVNEVLAKVEPHHQGINTKVAGNVPADYEFLTQVDPMLLHRPVRWPGWYRPSERFATTPSSPWSLMNFSRSAADRSDT
jgi:hypothetical protein